MTGEPIPDTDCFVAIRDGRRRPSRSSQLERGGQPTRVPTVVVRELDVGVGAGLDAGPNVSVYDSMLGNTPVRPLDSNIAKTAGRPESDDLASDDEPDLGPVVAPTGLPLTEPVHSGDEDVAHVGDLAVRRW